jgi:hypothetical protein
MLGTMYRQANAGAISPALPLAIQMLAMKLHSRRLNNPTSEILDGLCGQAWNVTVLELGLPIENDEATSFTLRYTV